MDIEKRRRLIMKVRMSSVVVVWNQNCTGYNIGIVLQNCIFRVD